MIGFLSGQVQEAKINQVIINVAGVGYRVFIPTKIKLVKGNKTELFIHTHVRDDAFILYGFISSRELNLFETLITVSGIGPKIALVLISASNPEAIETAIRQSNVDFFTAIPGIGKKGAQRLIVELKPKLSQDNLDFNLLEQNSDLVSALSSLGFKIQEIKSAISQIDPGDGLEIQIKTALKLLKR